MAGVLAVQGPVTGVAGVFGGEPGCLFGSGVGHDRDRLVGRTASQRGNGPVGRADGWWPMDPPAPGECGGGGWLNQSRARVATRPGRPVPRRGGWRLGRSQGLDTAELGLGLSLRSRTSWSLATDDEQGQAPTAASRRPPGRGGRRGRRPRTTWTPGAAAAAKAAAAPVLAPKRPIGVRPTAGRGGARPAAARRRRGQGLDVEHLRLVAGLGRGEQVDEEGGQPAGFRSRRPSGSGGCGGRCRWPCANITTPAGRGGGRGPRRGWTGPQAR